MVARKPEIRDLHMSVDVEQHVLRLQVSVDYILLMEIFEAEQHFYEVEFGRLLREGPVLLQMEEELAPRAEFHENV